MRLIDFQEVGSVFNFTCHPLCKKAGSLFLQDLKILLRIPLAPKDFSLTREKALSVEKPPELIVNRRKFVHRLSSS
jgi:hypothetical protein